MKKLVLLITVIFLFTIGSAIAAGPYYVFDVGPDTDSVLVKINAEPEYEMQAPYRIDLTGYPSGTYTIVVKGVNFWGVSSDYPFDFTVKLPATPSNGRLER